jgi:hypothetical protein
VELDPLAAGFAGVLLEIHRYRDRYILLDTAPATGNRIPRFSSKDGEMVSTAFVRKLGCGFIIDVPGGPKWYS